jgi:hypothetical protein
MRNAIITLKLSMKIRILERNPRSQLLFPVPEYNRDDPGQFSLSGCDRYEQYTVKSKYQLLIWIGLLRGKLISLKASAGNSKSFY